MTRSRVVIGAFVIACGTPRGGDDAMGSTGSGETVATLTVSTSGDVSLGSSAVEATTDGAESSGSMASTDESTGGSESGPQPSCDPPSWYPARAGTVVAIPAMAGAATLDEAIPQPTPFDRSTSAHVRAWNGGVLLHHEGLPYLATHGGHGYYAGNEINVFGPLCGGEEAETPRWRVLWGPTPENQVQEYEPWNYDGNPNISHTRDTMAVLGDSFFRFWQAGPFPGVTGSRDTMRFDVGALSWDAQGVHPDVPNPNNGGIRGAAVADPSRGIIWVLHDGNSNLMSYDPATMTFETYAAEYDTLIEITAGLDPHRDRLLVWDGREEPLCTLFDLAAPDEAPLENACSGAFPPAKSGIEFDENLDRYVALGGLEALDVVHELDPDTMVWAERAFEGDTVMADDDNGHFGRFRFVEELAGYVFVGSATAPVYFFRP